MAAKGYLMDKDQMDRATKILDGLVRKLTSDADGPAWLYVGDAHAELEDISPRDQAGRDWRDVIMETYTAVGCGTISRHYFNKMRRVRNFFRAAVAVSDVTFTNADLARVGLGALDVACRYSAHDASRGVSALIACISEEKTIAEMEAEYGAYLEENREKTTTKTIALTENRGSVRALKSDKAFIMSLVRSKAPLFLGLPNADLEPCAARGPMPSLKSWHSVMLSQRPGASGVLGVDLLEPGAFAEALLDLAVKLEFRSTFFDAYWIFVRLNQDRVGDLCRVLSEIGSDRIGIVRLEDEYGWSIVREPARRQPSPDRRTLLSLDLDAEPTVS